MATYNIRKIGFEQFKQRIKYSDDIFIDVFRYYPILIIKTNGGLKFYIGKKIKKFLEELNISDNRYVISKRRILYQVKIPTERLGLEKEIEYVKKVIPSIKWSK